MKNFDLIDENTLNKIRVYCSSNKNEESCGLIYKNKNVLHIYKCKNIASDPKKYFIINDEDYEKCSYKGEIICCFHSHINNRGFSPEDIRESLKNDLPYVLHNVKQDKFYFFDAIKYKYYEKYIDMPYRNGITDCWSILNYFYENELNIKIENIEPGRELYPDEHLWARLHEQMYNYNPFSMNYELRKDFFSKNNFIKIEKTNPTNLKPYDILFFRHIGDKDPFYGNILLPPGDLILQHIDQKPSKISSLSLAHFRMIDFILRHKNFL